MTTVAKLISEDFAQELAAGKGLIVFDLGCYFPYENQDILAFDFDIGTGESMVYKRNHRYANHAYVTLSRKMGRRVCKYGYPVVIDTDKPNFICLCVNVGIKDRTIQICLPVMANVMPEKPVCGMTLHMMFDDAVFKVYDHIPSNDGGWFQKIYSNVPVDADTEYRYEQGLYVPMTSKAIRGADYTVVFDTKIELNACTLDEFILF